MSFFPLALVSQLECDFARPRRIESQGLRSPGAHSTCCLRVGCAVPLNELQGRLCPARFTDIQSSDWMPTGRLPSDQRLLQTVLPLSCSVSVIAASAWVTAQLRLAITAQNQNTTDALRNKARGKSQPPGLQMVSIDVQMHGSVLLSSDGRLKPDRSSVLWTGCLRPRSRATPRVDC